MALWFHSLKKPWFSGSMVVKKHVLWIPGRKKTLVPWSSFCPFVLLFFYFHAHRFYVFIKKFH